MHPLVISILLKITAIRLFVPATFIISLHALGLIILFFTNLIIFLLVFMLVFMIWKTAREKNHGKYKLISGLLIRRAAFYEGKLRPETLLPVTRKVTKLMGNKIFRKLFTEELISAKKNIAGTSAENLKHLYHQLELEKYALRNLKRRHWHIKSKAIQELTLMDMDDLKDDLFHFTNNKNELVRMEAQAAVVQFNGFGGLAFLDGITYSISEWQQIKLLQKLSHLPPSDFKIDNWLRSANNSVVLFALKLARSYHTFESHDIILSCLDHDDPHVRMEAIYCLGEIYTAETSIHLISRYWRESLPHQLLIIKVLQNIRSESDNTFLITLLYNDNYEMRLAAARALARSGRKGLLSLQEYGSNDKTLSNIIIQVKGELAA